MYTVFGGHGFVGRKVVARLKSDGCEVFTPRREDLDSTKRLPADLGHVIYCIGLTGNFRGRPFETLDAHVGLLGRLMRAHQFESWLYLSSTRVYGTINAATANLEEVVVDETSEISLTACPDKLYDLSKLAGESLCLSIDKPEVRVARLSNVFGTGQSVHTFLGSILSELEHGKPVVIGESPSSAKDYVFVDDVVDWLLAISQRGSHRLYNVCAGQPVTHREIAETLIRAGNNQVTFAGPKFEGPKFAVTGLPRIFPRISNDKLKHEFPNVKPHPLLDWLVLQAQIPSTPFPPHLSSVP